MYCSLHRHHGTARQHDAQVDHDGVHSHGHDHCNGISYSQGEMSSSQHCMLIKDTPFRGRTRSPFEHTAPGASIAALMHAAMWAAPPLSSPRLTEWISSGPPSSAYITAGSDAERPAAAPAQSAPPDCDATLRRQPLRAHWAMLRRAPGSHTQASGSEGERSKILARGQREPVSMKQGSHYRSAGRPPECDDSSSSPHLFGGVAKGNLSSSRRSAPQNSSGSQQDRRCSSGQSFRGSSRQRLDSNSASPCGSIGGGARGEGAFREACMLGHPEHPPQ